MEREQIIQEYLGQLVSVQVDRPIGYNHHGIVYPVNYGFIPGVIAGDGEAQDAYILGVDHPVEHFYGRVIAAVRRSTDCEDKLVVVPDGMQLHQGQIAEAVAFQEQFFPGTIDSLLRKSCGIIPYRNTCRGTEFLLLLQSNHCWSFPKGHMDPEESETDTALRELKEETGLTAVLDRETRLVSRYPIRDKVTKELVLFPGRVQGEPQIQPGEILDYRWFTAPELPQYLQPDTYAVCREVLQALDSGL